MEGKCAMESVALKIKINMTNFKNKNILVTGGTGFIGSHLVQALLKKRAVVHTTFLSSHPLSYFCEQRLDKKTIMHRVDITDFEKVKELVIKNSIEYIFHLAAEPLVEVAYANPQRTLETNIMGTVNVLEAARLYGKVKAIVIASSDKAYGKLTSGKYKETDALRGDHPYEVSKSAADLIAQTYNKTYNMPIVITRFGNIYGEGDIHFSRIIPGIMEAVIHKNPLLIRSNGKFERDYLYVKDVVEGYLLLVANIHKSQGKVYNFGSEDHHSVLSLISLVGKSLHKKIFFSVRNTEQNEIPYQSLDYSKITNDFGWKAKTKMRNIAPSIYRWYKKIVS